jgi:hypothetical protein
MNITPVPRVRPRALAAIVAVAVISAALVVATSGAHPHGATAHEHESQPGALTARQAAFHDAMRRLWEDHVTWTRLAIVSLAAGLPDVEATERRLLRNQTDIGNAMKPYYGRAAGNRLGALLREHIVGAVTLLQAAKAGDNAQITKAGAAWYADGDQVADLLHGANPSHWSRAATRSMMKAHLDQTLQEAQDRLQGRFAADARDYDTVHDHILDMADTLSAGIMRQFPQRFR